MNMQERIARGIYERRNGKGCTPWSRLPNAHRAPYLSDATPRSTAFWPRRRE